MRAQLALGRAKVGRDALLRLGAMPSSPLGVSVPWRCRSESFEANGSPGSSFDLIGVVELVTVIELSDLMDS